MTESTLTRTLSAQRPRLRALATLWALACLFAAANVARADVIGIGDILPSQPNPAPGAPPGSMIPNLPQFGGTVTENGGEIVVGGTGDFIEDTDTGQLTIDIPTDTDPLISDSGIIGDESYGSGLVTIVTIGSQWRIADTLAVGNFGQGTLELVAGGQLLEGPEIDSEDPDLIVVVGQQIGSQGYVNLRGNGSLLRSGTLTIGQAGFGQMSLTTRARVSSVDSAIIGDQNSGAAIGTGYVTVDGQLTRWTIGAVADSSGDTSGPAGQLVVGRRGRGILTVTNQGEVRVSDDNLNSTQPSLIIGDEVNSYGEVNITGAFSQVWSFGTATIGNVNGARGVVRASAGGTLRANAAITVGVDGLLEVSGGFVITPVGINNNGTIQTSVGSTGQIDSIVNNLATGEIRAAGTAERVREKLVFTRNVVNNAGGLITSIGGEMEFLAAVTNTGLIAGRDAIYRFRDPFTNAGTFAFSVGDSDVYGNVTNNGSLGVATDTNVTFYDPVVNNGNLTVLPGGAAIFLNGLTLQATSVVDLQLNATANVEEIGELQVFGTATLAGTLDLTTFAGLDPQPGDSFQIISATNILGTFSTVTFPPAPGNNWMIDYNPNNVILNYVLAPAFSGDFNGDNVVNGADLDIWRMNVGTGTTPAQGDADGDGDVDGNDFLIWQRTLGPVPVVAAVGSVPEPGSLVLAASALALVSATRRKRVTTATAA
jgi:T5SS/PEP-CTERM-associated repeat protein